MLVETVCAWFRVVRSSGDLANLLAVGKGAGKADGAGVGLIILESTFSGA